MILKLLGLASGVSEGHEVWARTVANKVNLTEKVLSHLAYYTRPLPFVDLLLIIRNRFCCIYHWHCLLIAMRVFLKANHFYKKRKKSTDHINTGTETPLELQPELWSQAGKANQHKAYKHDPCLLKFTWQEGFTTSVNGEPSEVAFEFQL